MEPHYWSTDDPHHNNVHTMSDWFDNEMPGDWFPLYHDGTYAEVQLPNGDMYEVHAAGNGDSYNHVVTFKLIDPQQPNPDNLSREGE